MGKPASKPLEPLLARDWSVRGLPPVGPALKAVARAVGTDMYDGRQAAYEAGLPEAPRPWRVVGWFLR